MCSGPNEKQPLNVKTFLGPLELGVLWVKLKIATPNFSDLPPALLFCTYFADFASLSIQYRVLVGFFYIWSYTDHSELKWN